MAGDLTGPLRSLVRALFRMNRPTTDGIGRMPSVLYFLRSESEQLTVRCESGSGRPCRSVPGPVIDKTNRFESDATFRDLHTISIATQQRTNETIVRAARIYFIKIYSSIFIKNIINYQTFNRFTSRSPHTRRNPGVFSSPCRATEHTIDKAFAPDTRNASGSARPGGFCVEPATGIPLIPCPSRPSPAESRFRQGRTDTDEIFIVWARSIHPPQDMPGKRSS